MIIIKPVSKLVSLENTANRGGGSCYEMGELKNIKEICLQNNLSLHLDGARLFNAIVEHKEKPEDYGEIFDSISLCLSKGLGAPVGSLLIGTSKFIHKARRVRKVFGGGMRQAGYLAAAGIFALENNVERFKRRSFSCKVNCRSLIEKIIYRKNDACRNQHNYF